MIQMLIQMRRRIRVLYTNVYLHCLDIRQSGRFESARQFPK
jgi:hypothetical protein